MKNTIVLTTFLLIPILCFSQKEKPFSNNEFRIIAGTGFTKTNFDLKKNSSAVFSLLEDVLPYGKGVWMNDFGIEYSRFLSRKNALSLTVRRTKKGQQSKNRFWRRGTIDSLEIPYRSGGTSFKLELITDQFLIKYKRLLYEGGNVRLKISTGSSMDFINNMVLWNYQVLIDSGVKDTGCCRRTYYNFPGNYFQRIEYGLKNYYFRLGFSAGFEFDYHLTDFLDFILQTEAEYLTDFLKKDARIKSNFLPAGTIGLIRFQTGLNFNF